METLIQCENAVFGYDGAAVTGELNFAVERGDYLCIAGENGSGKSTLVKGILSLITPLRGRIIISDALKKKTGYVSQQTILKKDFPASVQEIVLSGNIGKMGFRPFYAAAEKKKARDNMERLGIAHLKNACYRELSGGTQRRVLLARALCSTQELLVLDEPAAGLDPLISADVYRLLTALNKEMNMTIIMVSHALGETLKYANRILHLKDKHSFYGSPAEYAGSELGKQFMRSGA